MKSIRRLALAGVLSMTAAAGTWSAEPMKLPPMKKQATVEKVVAEHVDALNKSDWNRLMAQYPGNAEIHLPNGQVVKGRAAIGELFAGFVKAPPDGLKGIRFSQLSAFKSGGALAVKWKAEADFLEEPYFGSDAYITQDGMMAAMVSTFDGSKLKFKK
ncbi:nuclear transport factor 2 family protein [Variovorax sp. GT1P44]|uniref:nuclear transport factor 2 family protein n=1 Tax=Variovorax sp. GT1P44 TaxID=3443742 RepID=UPI003F471B18